MFYNYLMDYEKRHDIFNGVALLGMAAMGFCLVASLVTHNHAPYDNAMIIIMASLVLLSLLLRIN